MGTETETMIRGNSTTTGVSALTAAITPHTAANMANFTKMMNMFQTHMASAVARPPTPSIQIGKT